MKGDYSIATRYNPTTLENPMNAMVQMSQIQQARNQNALAQRKFDAEEQAQAQQNALTARMSGADFDFNNPIHRRELLRFGTPGIEATKGLTDIGAQQATMEQTKFETKSKRMYQALSDIAHLTTVDSARSSIGAHLIKGDIDKQKYDMLIQTLNDSKDLPTWQLTLMRRILKPEEQLAQTFTTQDLGGTTQIYKQPTYAGGPPGETVAQFTKTPTPDQERLAAGKPMTEAQLIKLRTDVGKDHSTAQTTLAQLEEVLDSVRSVQDAPGLEESTGWSSYLPSIADSPAAITDTRIENLTAKITAMGRTVAAMSGAVGPMAVQEWRILADQVAVIRAGKGKLPLLEQVSLIEAQATGAMERIREKYITTRSEDFVRFPQFSELTEPKVRATGDVDSTNPLLKKD